MSRIFAIDTDSKQIAWAALEQDGPTITYKTGTMKEKGKRADDRFPGLVRQFTDFLIHNFEGGFVFLERPAMGRNANATIVQSEMLGAMKALLVQLGIAFSVVDNTVWKKGLLGNGHADKEAITGYLRNVVRDGALPESQDERDAFAIALWGIVNMPSAQVGSAVDARSLGPAGS